MPQINSVGTSFFLCCRFIGHCVMFVDDAQACECNRVCMGTRCFCHVLTINQLQERSKDASFSKFLHADSIVHISWSSLLFSFKACFSYLGETTGILFVSCKPTLYFSLAINYG